MVIGLWLRAVYAPEWLAGDGSSTAPIVHPWSVEADCYSQLARVQRILHGQGLIQNHFAVENWPEGLTPSTTAPFDYAILLLYLPLLLFTKYPLDWAGALISPFLWLALMLFWMLFRSREFNRAGRAILLIGLAAMPPLVWATAFGRPRHQSLILFLMAIGLTAEYERWALELSAKRLWNIGAGIIWGLACWTSLYEPLLVVTLLILFNLIVRRKENPGFLISFGAVMLLALLLEGFHIFIPPEKYHAELANWLGTVAEMRSINLGQLAQQLTFILLPLPVIAWRLLLLEGDRRTDWLLVLLAAVLIVLTAFQLRWVYYACLGELILIARYCQVETMRWPRLLVLAVFLIGLIDAQWSQLKGIAGAPANQPSPQLEKIARSIDAPGGIMAPWWLSPGLLYFSGQPIVTGSSHCGISGIVDGARFYTSRSWVEAERILNERQVRWIVVYRDAGEEFGYPALKIDRNILGLPPYDDETRHEAPGTVEQILASDRFIPTSMHLRCITPQLILYEYTPAVSR